MVLAPEHPLVEKLTTNDQREVVDEYIRQAERQTDIQRESTDKEKTGVFTGGYAINPVNGRRIPVWIADYVLMSYGSGAIMAVPAHDERDFDFALKFGLPIIPVIARPDGAARSFTYPGSMRDGFEDGLKLEGIPYEIHDGGFYVAIPPEKVEKYIQLVHGFIMPGGWSEVVGSRWVFIFDDVVIEWDSPAVEAEILRRVKERQPGVAHARSVMQMLWEKEFYKEVLYHSEYGMMIHSAEFTSTPGDIAKTKVIEWLEQKGVGKGAVNYRLRDWLISRQRYWGAPIPIVYCPKHGAVPVPDDQLPVLLPDDVAWKPTGESPLKLHPTWKQTTCPVCGGPAERETDTMDTFMCSSWYHLRYLSPWYTEGPFDPKEYDYWMPVDTYTGGIEHATMHLIYTRFFHKAGRDMGIMKGDEPMLQLRNQGMVLGEDHEKMSKSRGNVVAPDDLVKFYGADALRAYLMFFARWEMGAPWSSTGIEGTTRWLRRIWALFTEPAGSEKATLEMKRSLRRKLHQTVRQLTHDFEVFQFNTTVSGLMELLNEMYRLRDALAGSSEWAEAQDIYLRMLAPIAPHIAEELWMRLGKSYSIHNQPWPKVDEDAAAEDEITLVLQINGKVRDRIQAPVSITAEQAQAFALANPIVQKYLEGRQPKKVVLVPGRLVNIVI